MLLLIHFNSLHFCCITLLSRDLYEHDGLTEVDPILAEEVHQPLLLVQLSVPQHPALHDGDWHQAVTLSLGVHRSVVSKGDIILLDQVFSKILHDISPMNLIAVANKLSSHGKCLFAVPAGEWQLVWMAFHVPLQVV